MKIPCYNLYTHIKAGAIYKIPIFNKVPIFTSCLKMVRFTKYLMTIRGWKVNINFLECPTGVFNKGAFYK